MSDSILALDTLALTALIHRGTRRRRAFWEATCPQLAISVRADSSDQARDALQRAVQEFLQTASAKEIRERLEQGTTYRLEPLVIAPIVRDDSAAGGLKRLPQGAVVAVGAAKDKAGELVATVGGAASTSGQFVADKAANAYGATKSLAGRTYARTHETLAQNTVPLLAGLTQHAGNVVETLGAQPNIRRVAKAFKLDYWLNIGDQVDLEKAARIVAELKAKHPQESNRQIAAHLIGQKAVYAGGVGLSTSLLPGAAVPLLALDLAATALLQAELVFQIAAAYGLDLDDPARKGEMLAVFGCVLGGGKAVKAAKVGVEFLRNAPVTGAVIGATSNAAMIYALGHVACSFYEKKLYLEASPQKIEEVRLENALYLAGAARQQAIADQILLRVVRAVNPTLSKAELLQALHALNFGADSLATMENHFDSQSSLEELLAQLDGEFAPYVWEKAQQIAHADSALPDGAAEVLQIIQRALAL